MVGNVSPLLHPIGNSTVESAERLSGPISRRGNEAFRSDYEVLKAHLVMAVSQTSLSWPGKKSLTTSFPADILFSLSIVKRANWATGWNKLGIVYSPQQAAQFQF